jgi:hypothetical protein
MENGNKKPIRDIEGVYRISIGDLRKDGAKQIMYVGVDNQLHVFDVHASSTSMRLKQLTYINDLYISPLSETTLQSASFFDFDDTGSEGMLLETTDKKLKGYIFLSNENNYFLKALSYDENSVGHARVGVSYQYLMTDVSGHEILRAGHQTIANAYRALQLPFMLDGLTRCQNYIEYLSFAHYNHVSYIL